MPQFTSNTLTSEQRHLLTVEQNNAYADLETAIRGALRQGISKKFIKNKVDVVARQSEFRDYPWVQEDA